MANTEAPSNTECPPLTPITPFQEAKNTENPPPLTPITPFHLNFQAAHQQPQDLDETPKPAIRRPSAERTPLVKQPLSPQDTDTTPVLKAQPTLQATLSTATDQENRPPSSVKTRQAVRVQPKTPKTPKPRSLSESNLDFEPFVFKLLGRLRYPNWRRFGSNEINSLDHEELMRVFAFFLALFDEDLGYTVDKGGFTKAFNQFRESFRQVGFLMTLSKRNFLNTNKRPILPYLKMIVDKVVQKYGSVEKLCRAPFDYEALLAKYEQRNKETRDVKPPPTTNRRRRRSVPSDSGKSDPDDPTTQRKKRRRKSDATGLKRSSTNVGPIRRREESASSSPAAIEQNETKMVEASEPVMQPPAPVVSVPPPQPQLEPQPQPTLQEITQADVEDDVEMKDVDTSEPADEETVTTERTEEGDMDVDVEEPENVTSDENNDEFAGMPNVVDELDAAVSSAIESSPVIKRATDRINELLVEKDMIIQEKAAHISQLDCELKEKLEEIETLVVAKTQVVAQLEVAQQSLVEERDQVGRLSDRLQMLEKEKSDRETEKQELWEKITKTSDQYQATLQQKEDVINDLMNQVSTLKLQLAQNQQALMQMQHQASAVESGTVEEAKPEKVTVVGKIDFGVHVRNESLSTLRVVDLQKYLKANGLDTKGRKRELVKRVKQHFSS